MNNDRLVQILQMKMTLLNWDDDYVRVLWGGYPYRMERDLFEYLVYED